MGLPDALKFRGPTPKALLTRSLRLPLPESIVDRPKRGFVLPFDSWMRGPLRTYCEARLIGPEGLGERGVFSSRELQRIWQSFLDGSRDVSWSRLWQLVALGAWLDRNGLGYAVDEG